MPAVAGIVCRPFFGRHWAGTRPGSTVVERGVEHRWLSSTVPIVHDGQACDVGQLRGESPRTREG